MALFEARDLVCVRGERNVFASVSFALEPGGALVLTGPNGSGKSSLLRLAAGLLPPARGGLFWQGSPIGDDGEAHRARLCYVGHQDPVKPVLSVVENLAFWARLQGGAEAGLWEALARLGLRELAELPGRLLSAGQRRRLNLARLLASPSRLWLLDEPSLGLDATSVAALEGMIGEHRAHGGIVLLATHAPLALQHAEILDLVGFAAPEAA